MGKILTGIFVTLALVSCENNTAPNELKYVQDKSGLTQDTTVNTRADNENFSDDQYLIELSENLNGLWISDNYLKNIAKSKSIYSSRNYDTKILGFILDKRNLQTDSAYLNGFTDHEGGYGSPIKYDHQKRKFVNHTSKLTEFAAFPEAFELNFNSSKILTMYFPKTKKSDDYRKINFDFQTEIRKILIAGKYTSTYKNSKIRLDNDGSVHNFNNFVYYELIADFGMGIDFDAIIFFKTRKGGNWSNGEIYKFIIDNNTLILQHIKTNWETLEHEISDELIIFELE
jgi:hypothetical protein